MIALTIIFIILLICISAFFSSSETGLTGSSRAKIHKLKMEGNKKAEIVGKLREDKDRLIGTILLGNNAVNIAATILATNLTVKLYGSDYNEFVLTTIMTLVILIFAEVIPKTYAFNNAERVALLVAPIFNILVIVLYPITKAVQICSDIIIKCITPKNKTYEDYEDMEGVDVLRGAIEVHHDEGSVVKDDRDMLGSILDLADTEVGEIMIHRKEMQTCDVSMSNAEIVEYMLSTPYTRIPFWENEPDNIIGVMHSKYLMRALRNHEGDVDEMDMRSIMREPWFVPENRNLKEQLQAFRDSNNHFAFVVDEYGALQGMLTLEDIIEEIVGQIEEEPERGDIISRDIEETEDGMYIVDGQISIRDLNRALDWNLSDEEASTLAGLIIYEAKLIPEKGQKFHFNGYHFEIVEKIRNQITRVKVGLVQ